MRVLAIEDNVDIIDFIRSAFKFGWPEVHLETALDGATGLASITDPLPDIILLDLGLPDISGFDVLKQIRLFSNVPVIIMSVNGDENYVVRGLDLGANEYIIKPLRPLELIARMKSILIKYTQHEDTAVSYGDLPAS